MTKTLKTWIVKYFTAIIFKIFIAIVIFKLMILLLLLCNVVLRDCRNVTNIVLNFIKNNIILHDRKDLLYS